MNTVMEQKSSLRLVFGDSPIVKVIDFLIEHREFDYNLTEIARNADIGWSTLHQFWKELVMLGLVKKTRRIGRAEMYKLAIENPLVKKLIDIDFEISKIAMEKELQHAVAVVD